MTNVKKRSVWVQTLCGFGGQHGQSNQGSAQFFQDQFDYKIAQIIREGGLADDAEKVCEILLRDETVKNSIKEAKAKRMAEAEAEFSRAKSDWMGA